MFRVATCANTMRPKATIQLTTMELVMGKPNGRAISTALADRPCSSELDGSVAGLTSWVVFANVSVEATRDVEPIAILQLGLRVINTAVSNSILMSITLVRVERLMLQGRLRPLFHIPAARNTTRDRKTE